MNFSKETKGSLDLIIPASVTAYVGYYYWKKKGGGDWRAILVPVVIAFILSYIIVSQVTKRILAGANKPPNITGAVDTPTPVTGGSSGDVIGTGFNPKPFTDRLKTDIYSFGWRDASIYKDLVALSNAQLQAVYNDWQDRYYSEDNETMIQAMNGEIYGNNLTNDVAANAGTIKERLKALGAT